ncbi:MAG: host-nuclease inhibitor Gam family protein [Clostridia bacterium]|nr:host-nuclease inhibitor Gam family protein [Clostridia bacterium]
MSMQELDIPQFSADLLDGPDIPDAPAEDTPEDEREQVETRRAAFTVDGVESATWCMRKLAQHRKRFNEFKIVADVEIRRAQAFVERQNMLIEAERAKLQREEDFFTGKLAEFYLPLHEVEPRIKSFKTPAGTFAIRQQQPEFQRDDVALLGYLKVNDRTQYVEVTERPKWADLKKVVDVTGNRIVLRDTGEIVEGVTVIGRGPKLVVTTEEV